jgi:hypothetical protein
VIKEGPELNGLNQVFTVNLSGENINSIKSDAETITSQ